MPQSKKRLPKGQVRKDISTKDSLSPKESDSANESDSNGSMEMLKPADRKGKIPTSEDCSSDEASDSLWSKLENDIARNKPLSINKPTCSDDLADKDTQKQLNTFEMCNIVLDGSSESDEDSDAESRKEILRSAEKRIFRKISTSESDTRKKRVHEKYESSSDSDSAPENVTFEAGRKTAMEVLKQRVDSIRQEKLRKKEQRKKKLENLKRQKEEKLVRLKGRPTGVENESGSCSSESTRKPVGKQNVKSEKSVILGQKIYFSSESETTEGKAKHGTGNSVDVKQKKGLKRLPANLLDSLSDQASHKQKTKVASMQLSDKEDLSPKKKQTKVDNSQVQWDTDFIPLEENNSVTQFGAVPLNKLGLRKKTVAEEASAFRKNTLYGNKIKRTPVNVNTIRQQKLKACGMDRLVSQH